MQKNSQYQFGLRSLSVFFIMVAIIFGGVTNAAAVSAIYYVDCSAASIGSGTQASPWNNLATVNATTFSAGDKILFKRGSVCTGQLWPKGSGAQGNPITISGYGTGAKPIIDGAAAAQPVVYLKDQNYWTIDGLEIRNSTDKVLYVDGTLGADLYGFTLTNLTVHDGGTHNNQHLILVGQYQQHNVHDVVVDGVLAYNGWRGIEIAGYGINKPLQRGSNNIIRNFTVHDVKSDGILLATTDGGSIDNSLAYRTGLMTTLENHSPNAIWTWDTNNAVVQNSEAYDNHTPAGSNDGGGFDIDWWDDNNIIQYNYGHDNGGYCIAVLGAKGAEKTATTNSVVRYNVCSNNGRDTQSKNITDFYFSTWEDGSLDGVQIYNNTSYWNPVTDSPAYMVAQMGAKFTGSRPNFIKNNIIYSTKPTLINLSANFVMDYNLYWVTGGQQPIFKYGGALYTGFSAFREATRQEEHGLYADPLLVNASYHANGDVNGLVPGKPATQFALQGTSPAINSGVDVCAGLTGCDMGTKDFLGNANKQAGAYDRGAVESSYTNPAPTYPPFATLLPVPHVDVAVPQVAGSRAVVKFQDESSWYGGRANSTCRSVQRVTTAGNKIRVKLSNDNSTDPITFTKVYAGIRTLGPTVRDNVQITFNNGQTSVTLQGNQQIYSDPINLVVNANEDVAVSVYVAGAFPAKMGAGWPDDLSPATYCTEYTNGGDHAADLNGNAFLRAMVDNKGSGPQLFLTAVDVYTNDPAGSIIVIGDSISAGTGTMGRNGYNRWSEILAYRLQASPRPKPVANMAVSGDTCAVANDWVLALKDRLQRDVLSQSGVSHVIMKIGTNDIYGKSVTAAALEQCIVDIRDQLRALNPPVKLVLGTIIPVNGQPNTTRDAVNAWIRANGNTMFNGYIDFDAAIRDPQDPNKIYYLYMPDGDNYHPNAAGHLAMGNMINLTLFDSVNGAAYAPPPAKIYADGENQLENPSFETVSTSPWYKYGTVGMWNNNVHEGGFNVQFDGMNAGLALWPSFDPNSTYTFSGWCKSSGGWQSAGVYAKDKDGSKEWDAVLSSSTDWQKLEVVFKPANLAAGKLEIGFWQAKGAGSSYCDDFYFAKTPNAVAQNPTGPIIGTILPPPGMNLLSNAGFESGYTPWWFSTGSDLVTTPASNVYAGTTSAKAVSGGGFSVMPSDISSFTTYILSATCRAETSADTGNLFAKIQYSPDFGNAPVTSTEWHNLSIEFSTAGKTNLEVGFWRTGGTGNIYCDNFSLSISPVQKALEPGKNVLANAGFETGDLNSWYGWGTWAVNTANPHSGLYNEQVGANSGVVSWPEVAKNTNYTMQAWCKRSDANQVGTVFAKIKGTSTDLASAAVTSTDYQLLSFDFNTGGGAQLEIGLWRDANAGSGSVFCDDFSLAVKAAADTTAPETQIDSQTPSVTPTTSTTLDVSFSSADTTATFQCSLDGAAYAACASPKNLSGLADGSHTFAVRGVDPAGNIDTTPASYTWTVDTTAPETQIDSKTPSVTPTTSTTLDVTFSSADTTATFQCSLDGAAYAACSSPKTLSGLAGGSHTFSVRAVDGVGNTDATPASYAWVVTSLPASFGKVSPANASTVSSLTPTLSWNASTGAVSYEYCIATSAAACTTWVSTGANTSVTLSTALALNTTYYWQARAVNAAGSTVADNGTLWTLVTPAVAPGSLLSRTGWTASASINSAGGVFALDGTKSATSAWYTGAAQAVGQWFQVDMKAVKAFSKIVLNQEFYTTYYPRGYQVFVSNDGVNWGTAVASGAGTSGSATTITFAAQNARYIRVKLTSAATSWWAITEFYVYAP